MTFVVSLGGSIVAPPEGPDSAYLRAFRAVALTWLQAAPDRRLILVVGGGGPARLWQKACKDVLAAGAVAGADGSGGAAASALPGAALPADEDLDWIGIMATRLNAQLVKAVMGDLCQDPVVTDPSADIGFGGRVLVAAGWKPGFSTDFDAVWLAGRFGADTVLNLSNVAKVYTADPKSDPEARPIDSIGWADFRSMVGDTWAPGANLPFDPIASARAQELGISVICAAGRDLDNLVSILEGRSFIGTLIGDKPGRA